MAEPVTLQLISTQAFTGGAINLQRADFTDVGNLKSATVTAGSRVAQDFFGFFGSGGVKAVTVFATSNSDDPRNVFRICEGTRVRAEYRLGAPQTVLIGPGDEIAFVTTSGSSVRLVVNVLAEPEHARLSDESKNIPLRVRLTSETGFSSTGAMAVSLNWSGVDRVLEAHNVGAGALPLEAVDPRESRFVGYSWRVRVSGCEGLVLAGPGNRLTGDAELQQLRPGQWSSPRPVSHDDLLSVSAGSKRAGSPTVIAEHEFFPRTPTSPGTGTEAPVPSSPQSTIDLSTWVNLSVNAAGALLTSEGLEMWTHEIEATATTGFHGSGLGNKSMAGAFALEGMPLDQLASLTVRYALRTPGVSHILGRPYVNLLIDLHGDGSVLKVGVLDKATNPQLSLLTEVSTAGPQEHEYTRSWVGGGKLKIVNELAGVVPVVSLGLGWLNKVFTIADIVAQYPNAKLSRGFPADNGLPADLSMPPLWLVLGDSLYKGYSRIVVREVRVNG